MKTDTELQIRKDIENLEELRQRAWSKEEQARLTGKIEGMKLALDRWKLPETVVATEYKNEDGSIRAILIDDGKWVLRSIFGPAFFWNKLTNEWDLLNEVVRDGRYIGLNESPQFQLERLEALNLLATLSPKS